MSHHRFLTSSLVPLAAVSRTRRSSPTCVLLIASTPVREIQKD